MAELEKTGLEMDRDGDDWDLIIESNRPIFFVDFKTLRLAIVTGKLATCG